MGRLMTYPLTDAAREGFDALSRDHDYHAHNNPVGKALWDLLKRANPTTYVMVSNPGSVGLTPAETDFLKAVQYSRDDIARIFQVPPYLLGGPFCIARGHRHMLRASRALKPRKYRHLLRRTA
jgi:hypothetical protein